MQTFSLPSYSKTDPSVQFGSSLRQATFGNRRSEDRRDDGTGGPRIQLAKASLTELPAEVRMKARLVRASHRAFKRGFAEAQTYLDVSAGGEAGWTIDRQLSTRDALVLTQEGRVKIAYRGTEPHTPDLVMDAASVVGLDSRTTQMEEFRTQMEQVHTKYGRAAVRELLGYSKGALPAVHLGETYGIRSTSFNPAVSAATLKTRTLKQEHTIFRTTEDLVSSTLMLRRTGTSLKVHTIRAHYGLGDPVSVHRIHNFTDEAPRAPGRLENATQKMVRLGDRVSEMHTLQQMHDGMGQQKTFTEALQVGDANDTYRDAEGRIRLGKRINQAAGTLRYWRQLGGRLSEAELADIAENERMRTEAPQRPAQTAEEMEAMGDRSSSLSESEMESIRQMDSAQLQEHIDTARGEFSDHINSMNEEMEPRVRTIQSRLRTEAAQMPRRARSAIRGAMPRGSSIAGGIASFYIAHEAMQLIDPNHAIPQVPAEAIEGGIAGATGAAMLAAMGASVSMGPEALAGAVGYVVGAETSYAMTHFLQQHGVHQHAAEGIGAVTGGAVGGVATSVVSMAASAALFGTALGPAGMLVGAALGATMGAAVGFAAWLIGGNHHDEERRRQAALLEARLRAQHHAHAMLSSQIKAHQRADQLRRDPRLSGMTPAQRDLYMLGADDLLPTPWSAFGDDKSSPPSTYEIGGPATASKSNNDTIRPPRPLAGSGSAPKSSNDHVRAPRPLAGSGSAPKSSNDHVAPPRPLAGSGSAPKSSNDHVAPPRPLAGSGSAPKSSNDTVAPPRPLTGSAPRLPTGIPPSSRGQPKSSNDHVSAPRQQPQPSFPAPRPARQPPRQQPQPSFPSGNYPSGPAMPAMPSYGNSSYGGSVEPGK